MNSPRPIRTLGILAVGGLAAILGCMVPGDGEGLDAQGKLLPRIAYPTPVSDTVGQTASHTPVSTGGAVTAYVVSPNLPAGLTLNATSGIISGIPGSVSAAQDYTVTATGPGGSTVAVINLEIAENPCVVNPNLPRCNTKPEFAYTSPVNDTLSVPVTHAPVSTGGRITAYVLMGSALPTGLSLDTITGIISGTPTVVAAAADYTVMATGPGGTDTAIVNIRVDDRCVYNPNLLGCPVPANYFNSQIQGPIFQTYCTSCHAPGGTGFTATGLNLNSGASYDSLVNKPAFEYPQMMRVRPGLPDSSYMYLKISGTPTVGTATQMPLALPPLNPALILRVQRWIAAGAPRN